jgi:hypothetical protein
MFSAPLPPAASTKIGPVKGQAMVRDAAKGMAEKWTFAPVQQED